MKKNIKIVEVKTKKEKKLFVDYPTELYRGVKEYVPPLRSSELENFDPKKNACYDECDVKYYLAYKDDVIVGRIAGIIQKAYNEKTGEKRVRFSRFDAINDIDVAKALFESVETWAKEKGMTLAHGPLGFNDLDREGLLIEGFDEIATFEEQYNYDYYQNLIEKCGYEKEVDWIESNIKISDVENERVTELSERLKKRFKLKTIKKTNINDFLKKYADDVFDIIDEAYSDIYGVVAFNDKVKKQIISQFKLFLSIDLISMVLDENDEPIAFGFAFPSLSEVMTKYKGKINLFSILPILKAVKKPKQVDLALIGVRKKWLSKGVPAIIMNELINSFKKLGVEACETNLNLETNTPIVQLWENMNGRQHKRRRAFKKEL